MVSSENWAWDGPAGLPGGGFSASPKALVVLVWMKAPTPASAASSNRLSVPVTLVSTNCACVWVTTFISLGYFLASRFDQKKREQAFEVIHHNLTTFAIIGAALLATILLVRWWLKRRAKRKREIEPE